MKRSAPVIISVPTPCSENWDTMTPGKNGRYCDQCRKTVIDFTSWSDTDLINFFSNKNESVCGRFLSTQLDQALRIPHQPASRLYRLTIALGLTLLFTKTPPAAAQNKPVVTGQLPSAKDTIPVYDTLKNTAILTADNAIRLDPMTPPMIMGTSVQMPVGPLKNYYVMSTKPHPKPQKHLTGKALPVVRSIKKN